MTKRFLTVTTYIKLLFWLTYLVISEGWLHKGFTRFMGFLFSMHYLRVGKLSFLEVFPYLLLSHGFSLVHVLWCSVRWDSWQKDFLQWLHSKVFSTVWVLWGRLRCDLWLKFSFSLAPWVFTPVLTLWCLKKVDFSHSLTSEWFFLVWVSWWTLGVNVALTFSPCSL